MERSRLTLGVHPQDLPPSYDSAMRASSLPPITASAPEPASAPYPVTPTSNPPYPVTPVLNRPPYPVTPDSGQPPYPIPRMHDPPGPGSWSSAQHSTRVPFPMPLSMPISIPIPMPQPMPVRMPMPESPLPSASRNPNPLPTCHSEAGTSLVRQMEECRDRRRKKQCKGLFIGIVILISAVIFTVLFKTLHHARNF